VSDGRNPGQKIKGYPRGGVGGVVKKSCSEGKRSPGGEFLAVGVGFIGAVLLKIQKEGGKQADGRREKITDRE